MFRVDIIDRTTQSRLCFDAKIDRFDYDFKTKILSLEVFPETHITMTKKCTFYNVECIDVGNCVIGFYIEDLKLFIEIDEVL